MRIALVTRRYPPMVGGAERVLGYLAPALAALGAEVVVLTSKLDDSPAHVEDGNLVVRRLATSRRKFVGTWLYMNYLRRELRRGKFDIIYVSMLKHDAYVAVGVGERLGIPVVLRPEGAGATGDLAWQGWGRFGRAIGRRCRRASLVVAISKAVAEELRASGYPRVVELPNGVPVPAEPWRRREGWRAAPRGVFVGRLAPEKGLIGLVDAWEIVRREHPAAVLTLVGEGPERATLEERVRLKGLLDAVRLPGAVADPSAALRESDLFLLPSKEEGMSIALLEAMALGMPLVASSIAGNRRLVADNSHGRLAEPGNPSDLARVILEQFAGYDRAVHNGRHARSRVVRDYSIEAVARRHLDLFRGLVDDPGGPPC